MLGPPVVSRCMEKTLSKCTCKNDEFNSRAKMTNSINCTKFSNDTLTIQSEEQVLDKYELRQSW